MSRYPWFDAGNIECHFQFSEACVLLSDVIDKFEKVVADEVFDDDAFVNPSIKSKLRERATDLKILRRNYGDLIEILARCWPRMLFDPGLANQVQNLEEEILSLVYSVEGITSSFLCKREMGKKKIREQSMMATKMVMSLFLVFFITLINQRVLCNEMKKGKLIGGSLQCFSLFRKFKKVNDILDYIDTPESE